jgi:hypothetical protein|tara:strand:- start:271 stop:519 length:249 start_codon:yes stop_codon:yes gene_type:complete
MDPSTTYTSSLLGVYILLLIILLMIAYSGVEGTLRVFAYLDLQFRYAIVRLRMFFIERKLRKRLLKDTEDYAKLIKEIQDDQ